MQHITAADESSPYDLIYVEKNEECSCDFDFLLPSWMISIGITKYSCLNCGKTISAERIDDYKKYFGFHGYDEVEECND